jgi:ketosteroid isomerase-like protein
MAPADIDRVRAGYEAFNRRDLDGILRLLSDDIEYRMPLDPMGVHPVFRGRQGVSRFYTTVWDGFDEFRIDVESVDELTGGVLVAGGSVTARPPGGPATTFRFSHFWKIADGRAVAVSFHDAVNPLTLLETASARPEGATEAGEEGALQ